MCDLTYWVGLLPLGGGCPLSCPVLPSLAVVLEI
jgi:hypothetical protein